MSEVGAVIWFTGIPAAGKSTLAAALEQELRDQGLAVENLDSDAVRAMLSPNLGFTPEARDENTRRLAWMAQLLSGHGINVLVAAVSPLRKHRDRAREWCERFVEVFVDCPGEVCQQRDPKGLYARAARGEISDIAGLHMPYDPPAAPEVTCHTDREDIATCTDKILRALRALGYLP